MSARGPKFRVRERLTDEDMVALRAFVARYCARPHAAKALGVARETLDELMTGSGHAPTLARVRKTLRGDES